MAVILDESGGLLLDEALADLLDEAGLTGMSLDSSIACSFSAYTSATARATMEFEAGQPVQFGLTTLASDPWISSYPG